MWASPVTEISVFATEISVTGLENLPFEHSSPVTGMKLERSRLVHLGNWAEISYMDSNQADITARFPIWTEVKICPANRANPVTEVTS